LSPISTDTRTFKAFRLEIANAILRNNAHISALLADIDSQPHIIELCDTYAMRLLLAWLATKYGCSLFTSSIHVEKPNAVPTSETFFHSFGIYPFAENFPVGNEAQLFETANAFLDAAFEPSIELAGSLHEHMTSCEFEVETFDLNGSSQLRLNIRSGSEGKYGRRKRGQFYTPPWVVDYCLEKSLNQDLANLMKALQQKIHIDSTAKDHQPFIEPTCVSTFKILDPACGTGNFLLGILRYLIAREASADEIVSLASNSLYGRDVDGKAVSIAIWSIVLAVSQFVGTGNSMALDIDALLKRLRQNLRVTDSVLESFGQNNRSVFDLVITNPPYISFGSRNQEKILESTALFLRRNFPISAEYKIRLNSIFQEVALNYVRDGGKICLFVPNSFLTGMGYAKLRRALLQKTRIISLTELREDTMKNAVVGRWCVAVYQRDDSIAKGPLEYPIELVTFSNPQNRPEGYRIKASHLVTTDQSRFRLVFRKLDEELALRFEHLAPLSSVARGHTGIRARAGQKTILADTQKTQLYKHGIKSGGQVKPFSVEWDGTWLKIDPALLFSGGFDNRVVENPKLMLRQTADRIIAAYDESGLYHLNNVHSFSCQKIPAHKQIDLHLLLALMNSNLWHFVYRLKTREDGRALAQIDIETVETMPLPDCEESLLMRISELGKLASAVSSEDRSHLSDGELRAEIDRLVYCAYDLSRTEIDHVESSLGLGYNSPLLKTGAG
jgi:SAM-dependent methyltransferase